GHLQRQHKVSHKEAEAVGQQIRSWAGLVQYPSELEVPSGVPKPVRQLPVHYFQVQPPDEDGPDVVPVDGAAAWAQVGEQMAKAWQDIERRAQTTIQEGERDEVNPWLERTQWLPYLVGMERPDLLACIEEPVAEPDARQEQQAEPVEAAIWAAMDGLARFSQASIIDRIGVFIRLEAIRTEMHQTRFQPLQPYMDKNAIVKHTRPWQQMLMFFARTQKEHAWKSPKYR
ncbi:hypothetical protein PtrSN001A_012196, partial [Pyrenophora tritici-repentis]